MSEEIIDGGNAGSTNARPTFLTVLCILTWVGSGIGLLGLLADGAKYQPTWYNIFIVVLNLATAYGAFLMWGLKKQGLLIYTAAQIAGIVLSGVFVYVMLPGSEIMQALPSISAAMVQSAASTMFVIGAIFPIAFLIMYWINAKHLK